MHRQREQTSDVDDQFILTEVGAYEAINSNVSIVTASSSSAPMADDETLPDDIQYYLQEDVNAVQDSFGDGSGGQLDCKPPHRSTIMSNAAASKAPRLIKCPQCRRVHDFS